MGKITEGVFSEGAKETTIEIKRNIKEVVSNLNKINRRKKKLEKSRIILEKRELRESIKFQKKGLEIFRTDKIPEKKGKIIDLESSLTDLKDQLKILKDKKQEKQIKSDQFYSKNIQPLQTKFYSLREIADRNYWKRRIIQNERSLKADQREITLMKSAGDHPSAIKRVNEAQKSITKTKEIMKTNKHNYNVGYKKYQNELEKVKTQLDINKEQKRKKFNFKNIINKITKKPIQIKEKQKTIKKLKKELNDQAAIKENIKRNLEMNQHQLKTFQKTSNTQPIKPRYFFKGKWKLASHNSVITTNEEIYDLNELEKQFKSKGNKLFDRLRKFETALETKRFKKTYVTSKLLK